VSQPLKAELPTESGVTAAKSIQTIAGGAAPELDFVASDIVTKYDVLEKLGEGGMGEVHKAQQRGVNRLVAIKSIKRSHSSDPHLLARFKLEVEAVGRLQHPNIVQIFDVGEMAHRPCYVMEFVQGGTLKKFCHDSSQPPEPAARLVRTLAQAMAYCHQRGIIHRDLKPGNILLARRHGSAEESWTPVSDATVHGEHSKSGQNGHRSRASFTSLDQCQPKISDFGLAKLLDVDIGQTVTEQLLGTPGYMSPEQFPGRNRPMTPLVDVYALGAILYFTLTGRAPFVGQDWMEIMFQVKDQEVTSPRQLRPEIPADLETITLKCMQKEPAKRYASAEALADDLTRFLNKEPILARPVNRLERLWRWCRRNRVAASLIGAVAASLLGGAIIASALAVWALGEKRRAEQETVHAIDAEQLSTRRWYAAEINRLYEEWKKGDCAQFNAGMVSMEKDPHASPDLRSFEWGYLQRLRHLDLHTFGCPGDRLKTVAYSPDGRYLVCAGSGKVLRIWDIPGERLVATLRGHKAVIWSVAYRPDGRQIATASADGTVKLWNPVSQEEEKTLSFHPGSSARAVAYSSDGGTLASTHDNGSVKLWDVKSGKELRTLTGHVGPVRSVAFAPDGRLLATGGVDKTLILWDVASGKVSRKLKVHTAPIASVCWSSDGTTVASAGEDGRIQLRDSVSDAAKQALYLPDSAFACIALDQGGRRLVSASNDHVVRIWDLEAGKVIRLLRGHIVTPLGVGFSPDGRTVASVAGDMTKVWDVRDRQDVLSDYWDTNRLKMMAFEPVSSNLVLAAQDGSISVRNSKTGLECQGRQGRLTALRPIVLSGDGQYLAVGGPGQRIVISRTDGAAGEVSVALGELPLVLSLALDRSGRLLASGHRDGAIRLWNPRTGQSLGSLPSRGSPVEMMVMSPDGHYLASIEDSKNVCLWDVDQLRPRGNINVEPETASSLAFSANEERIAIGTAEDVRICETVTARPTLRIKQKNELGELRLAFSPDGRRIALANCLRVLVWDAQTGQQVLSIPAAPECVCSVVFDSSSQMLAGLSGLTEGFSVWDGRELEPRAKAERQALSEVNYLYGEGFDLDAMLVKIYDNRTISEEVRQEAIRIAKERGRALIQDKSHRLVHDLFGKHLLREEVLQLLHKRTDLDETIRKAAIELAAVYPEQAELLSDHARDIALDRDAGQSKYARALKEAELALRLDPDTLISWLALGAAQYRTGHYDDAISTLTHVVQADMGDPELIRALAFLAMAQHRRGLHAQAQDTLHRYKRLLDNPKWSLFTHRSLDREVDEEFGKGASPAR
jgi:WD40 repeat protein/serine/threonine protein kinase